MKFIHTADIHLGMTPDAGHAWSKDRAQAIRETFADIVRLAGETEADFLFISGDLFHRQPLGRDLKEADYLFSTIPNVQVVIIAGNHDHIENSSALHSFSWGDNVSYIMDEKPRTYIFNGLGTDVTGLSYHDEFMTPEDMKLSVPAGDRIHILLMHGGDEKHLPFDKASLPSLGFSYVALGHIHKPELSKDMKWAYPGSPEPLDRTETGSHGVVMGEVDDLTGEMISLKFMPMASARYISLSVHVSVSTTNAELTDRVRAEIEKRGANNIYRFRLCGRRDPQTEFDLDYLAKRYQIVEISDETEPQYDLCTLFEEHPDDMIGFYIRRLERDDMSRIEKKALHYGIDALLSTTDERSGSR